jgi:hypothetical protein
MRSMMSNTRKSKPQPELLGKGQYAIYQAPNGDGVIAYRPEGEEKDSHQVVPARFWSVMMKMLRGEITEMNPMALAKMMIGR